MAIDVAPSEFSPLLVPVFTLGAPLVLLLVTAVSGPQLKIWTRGGGAASWAKTEAGGLTVQLPWHWARPLRSEAPSKPLRWQEHRGSFLCDARSEKGDKDLPVISQNSGRKNAVLSVETARRDARSGSRGEGSTRSISSERP